MVILGSMVGWADMNGVFSMSLNIPPTSAAYEFGASISYQCYSTTYFCDAMWSSNSGIRPVQMSSHPGHDHAMGIFTIGIDDLPTETMAQLGASISDCPSTTYFCDAFWTTNSGNMYTIIGGWLDDAGGQGAFAQWVCGAASYTHLNVGASIS